jgi:microcystin-dependent protein
MSTPFLGEIRIFAFNFAPRGWALCNGQLLPINQNQALFALLGTTYGGNGQTNFALPSLQGRTPIHVSGNSPLGQSGGTETETLQQAGMPAHSHPVTGSSNTAGASDPAGAYWAVTAGSAYSGSPNTGMAAGAVSTTGGSQPHNNLAPFLVLNFCIALTGIFPSRP